MKKLLLSGNNSNALLQTIEHNEYIFSANINVIGTVNRYPAFVLHITISNEHKL